MAIPIELTPQIFKAKLFSTMCLIVVYHLEVAKKLRIGTSPKTTNTPTKNILTHRTILLLFSFRAFSVPNGIYHLAV